MRWLTLLDALAPSVIVVAALIVARQPFASTRPMTVIAIIATVALGTGTALGFFRTMPAWHNTWPTAFGMSVILLPLIALHTRFERIAVTTPVPVHLLPLAFTWTGMLAVSVLLIGMIYTLAAPLPAWAGAVITPAPLLIGAIPALSVNPSTQAVFTAALAVFAAGAVIIVLAWMLPERHRWFLIPFALAVGAFAEAGVFLEAFHHFPGRVLLLGDAALALLLGLTALASPLLCRWLGASTRQ